MALKRNRKFFYECIIACGGAKHPHQLLAHSATAGCSYWFRSLYVGCYAFAWPKRNTADKLVNFESGIPSIGNARQPMAIKYFLVAILFVLFDVEVIFFYPYAINFKALGLEGFYAVVMFVAFFLCGFIYIIKKGALEWED